MPNVIEAGRIFIREGTLLPGDLRLESESYSPGWRAVTSVDSCAMDQNVHASGWTFFCLAGESKTTAFGRDGQKTVCRAIKKILASLKSERCNSIEITGIAFKTYFRIPYAKVSFHLRNLQKGMVLLGSQDSDV